MFPRRESLRDRCRSYRPAVEQLESRLVMASGFQNGIAPEYLVNLANALHSDVWNSMPHLADNDYLRQVTSCVRDRVEPGMKVFANGRTQVTSMPTSTLLLSK